MMFFFLVMNLFLSCQQKQAKKKKETQ